MKIEKDKLQHFVAGFLIAGLMGWACMGVLVAGGVGREYAAFMGSYGGLLLAGFAGHVKELMDAKDPSHHTYDGWDAFATGGGGWFGACVFFGITLFISP